MGRDVTVAWGTPNVKQDAFLRERHRYVAYGGARGGGKSWVVRYKAAMMAMQWPGIKILIMRRTFQELNNNHVIPLQQMLTPIGVKYNKQDHIFTFPRGSTIKMGYCDNDTHLGQYQGAEFDVIFFDEATNFKQEWVERILPSVRGANTFPKRAYFTCNPGGPGHGYIKRLFIDRKYKGSEKAEDYAFIKAKATDNTVLMKMQPDYLDTLKALSPKLRRAWMEGEWDVLEGQVFEEFRDDPEHYKDRQWTHVIEGFEPGPDWTLIRGFDWGYNKPFSMAWYAVDRDGILYRILEMYGCVRDEPNTGVKWTPDQVFEKTAKIEREHPWLRGRRIRGIADPAIWDAEVGVSIEETAARHGIYFEKGDHKRIAGWMQCHYRLSFDEQGYPRFYVFDNCTEFIRTVPLLEYDKYEPEDVDSDGEDHIADEWRYVCMSRPVKPRVPAQEPEFRYMVEPLDRSRRRRRQ